jgi:hypothetical protein
MAPKFASRSEALRYAAQKAARHPTLYAIVQAWLRGEINQEQFDRQYADAEAIITKLRESDPQK